MTPRTVNPDDLELPHRGPTGRWAEQLRDALPALLKGKAVSVEMDGATADKTPRQALYTCWENLQGRDRYGMKLSIRKDIHGTYWMLLVDAGSKKLPRTRGMAERGGADGE